jgi:hypothetical protein
MHPKNRGLSIRGRIFASAGDEDLSILYKGENVHEKILREKPEFDVFRVCFGSRRMSQKEFAQAPG